METPFLFPHALALPNEKKIYNSSQMIEATEALL